jgi:hypothetical protein
MVWHCFLDTDLFFSPPEIRERAAALARQTGTSLYIPETAVIERRCQVVNQKGADADSKRMTEIIDSCGSVVPIPVVTREELSDLVGRLAAEKLDLKVRDATIFLTSVRFAAERGLAACMLVTGDTDFKIVFNKLVSDSGVRRLFFSDLEELRKALDARPEIADKLQTFMEGHEGLVLGYLYERRKSEMVEAINVRVPGAVDESTPMEARGPIFAVPEHPPRPGEPCLASFTFGVDMLPAGREHITFTITGRALVRFENDEFVGAPEFHFPLEVSPPSI